MKANKILPSALLALLLLGSCTSDDLTTANTLAGAGKGNIHLTIGGSAKQAGASRAGEVDLAGEVGERAVNSLYAVLFDTHDGFYKTIRASDLGGGEYDFLVEKDATYNIYFVANPSASLVTQLENIATGTPYDEAPALLSSIVTDQAPDDKDNFLMYHAYTGRVTTTITKTANLGEISLSRRASRFDIVNEADGITVTKVIFNKRSVKYSVRVGNYNPEAEGLLESTPKVYEPANLVGSKENPGEYRHEIYSYPNYSLNPDSVPSIDIEYIENVDGQDVKRMHTVRFIDPDSPANTPLAIKMNRLYTITLTKAYKLEFNLSVSDWAEGETFTKKELPLDLNEERQDTLNRNLLVYDLFAEYNAKSISDDGTVTFFDELICDPMQCPESSYFQMTTLESKGLLNAEYTHTDKDGNVQKYRLPTCGELALLLPVYQEVFNPGFIPDSTDVNGYTQSLLYTLRFTSTSRLGFVMPDYVYLKNNADGTVKTNIEDESDGFVTDIELRTGSNYLPIIYNDNGIYTEEGPDRTSRTLCACYAVRFKGTSQYSAYKWEPINLDGDPTKLYYSIKIKALPPESNVVSYDLVDNVTFWEKGYIEYTIPMVGNIDYKGNRARLARFSLASNSMVGNQNVYGVGLPDNASVMSATHSSTSLRKNARLVKVKD